MTETRTRLENGVWRHSPGSSWDETEKSTHDTDLAKTEACLRAATDLGFVRSGVAHLEPFHERSLQLQHFIASGRSGNMDYLNRKREDGLPEREFPADLLPGARAAISVALPYPATLPPTPRSGDDPLLGAIARYAQGADYHSVIKEKLLLLADQVANIWDKDILARAAVDTAPIFERDLALRAGFAFLGKHTLAIAPGAGSNFLLGELLVDVPLLSSSTQLPEACGSCRACLEACPTDAFLAPFELDASKCISYLTIESPEDVPMELRHQVGNKVFGCDVCQSVCPYNRSGAKRAAPTDLAPRASLSAPELIELLTITSSRFRKLVKGTALRRVNRYQLARNAAVALGNSGDARAIAPLVDTVLATPKEMVKRHCLWALSELSKRHGLTEASRALEDLHAKGEM